MKIKKADGLFAFFLKYLVTFCILNVIVAILLVVLFLIGLATHAILPANFAEQQLWQNKEMLEKSETITPELLPLSTTYLVINSQGNVIEGNMKAENQTLALQSWSNPQMNTVQHIFTIEKETETYLIYYDMNPHFANQFLHRMIPRPDILFILIFFFLFVVLTILTALSFGRKLNTQLAPLINATEAIKNEELAFEIESTKIKEFNDVLNSIDEMRIALKASLQKQWDGEQNRRTQMAALTHDIKTPLTLVKGNAELLLESEIDNESKELVTPIHQGARKIEEYLALLMEAATAENPVVIKKECFDFNAFIHELVNEIQALSNTKQIKFTHRIHVETTTFYGDRNLIYRALMNIADNAMNYAHHEVHLSLVQKETKLEFIMTDDGNGFSKTSLKQATEQFYTEKQARSGKHYGMGLFLAKLVAQEHHGHLSLANSSEQKGAVVLFTIQNEV